MDWQTILQGQQTDFINRLQSGDLLQCDHQGKHSELTVITGDSLGQLRDFCWDMANKYKRSSSHIRDLFVNNMKGKLGEEVVKTRLGDLLTDVDYEQYQGGDGKVDFTLAADSSIGIQVKARQGKFNEIEWSISQEEINKNAVLICILIEEEVSEAQTEYHLVLAGFLPTNMTTVRGGKARVKINELLYSGGLRSYLESLTASPGDYTQAIKLNPNYADAYYNRGIFYYSQGEWDLAVADFTQAIKLNPNYAGAYFCRGVVYGNQEEWDLALADFTQAIKLNPNDALAYNNRGIVYGEQGEWDLALADYTQAIKLNPNDADAYHNRGVVYGDQEEWDLAVADYTQAIKLNPNDAGAYHNRGVVYRKLGDINKAREDFQRAKQLYRWL
ncbi:TPR repeat-containing protein [Umezakia ovalisporum]|uniref:tetratricopeptide repeat protein n=1 Tax=Umezakia ovalisporum TaxID=75695 RepID=UPI0006F04078|nr:TPR repeat-containing protein [Umezakia ovalisporum]